MATESSGTGNGLVRRTATTVRTLVDPETPGAERARAGLKTVGVAGGVITGGLLGVEELAMHAGGALNAVWSVGEPGIIVGGSALVLGGGATVIGRLMERYNENNGYGNHDVHHYNRGFYRIVGVASVVVGGTLAVVGGGMEMAQSIGLSDMSHVAHALLGSAEAFGAAGVVGLGLGAHWHKRLQLSEGSRPALGE